MVSPSSLKQKTRYGLLSNVKLLLILHVWYFTKVHGAECPDSLDFFAEIADAPDSQYYYTIGKAKQTIDLSQVFNVTPESDSGCWYQKVTIIDILPTTDEQAITVGAEMVTIYSQAAISAGSYRIRVEAMKHADRFPLKSVNFTVQLLNGRNSSDDSDHEGKDSSDELGADVMDQNLRRLQSDSIPTSYKQCNDTGSLVTTPALNFCSLLPSTVCPVTDDLQSICYALSSRPDSLSDDDANLFRLTHSSLPRAFVNSDWSSAADEFPEEGSEVIDYDYGSHQTRWVWFTTTSAEGCSMTLFENTEPQFVFTVEEDCSARADDNSFGDTVLSTNPQELTEGITGGSVINKQSCEKRNNKLTQMKVWKDETKISGFEAVFEVDDETGSYPQTVLLFGTKSLVTGYEEATITEEVFDIGFFFHDQDDGSNLASIKLKGETISIEFSAYTFDEPSTGWYDLNTRLIGFDVLECEDGSICAIGPLEDFSSCQLSLSSSDSNSLEMTQLIDVESDDDQIVTLDLSISASTPFGEQCSNYELVEWTVVDGHDSGGSNIQTIQNWSTSHTLEDIKNICKTNGYSGFLISNTVTHGLDTIYFKKFNYQLKPDMLSSSDSINQYYISYQNLDSITLSGTELTLKSNKDTPASIQTITLAPQQIYDYGGQSQKTLESIDFELSVNIYRKSDYPISFSYCEGTFDLNVVDLAASLGYVRPLTAEDPQICFYIEGSCCMRLIGPTYIGNGALNWNRDNDLFNDPDGQCTGGFNANFNFIWSFKYVSDSSECNSSFHSSHEPIYTTNVMPCVDPRTPKAPFTILTPTNPQHQPMLNGQEVATVDEVTWHVPYKFYSLSKLIIWPTPSGIQGFEVTFSVPDYFTGYEQQRQMFGSSISVKDYQSVTITDEITDLKLRSDSKVLREIQLITEDDELAASVGQISDEEEQEIAWRELTISIRKLIGFHTKTTITEDGNLWMIKSIAPILDASNCENATPNSDPETFEALTMSQHQNSGQTDSLSSGLKLVDIYKYELCSFELSITPSEPFIWVENNQIKLRSNIQTSEQSYYFSITMTPTHSEAEYEPGPWIFPLEVEILPAIPRSSNITVTEVQEDALITDDSSSVQDNSIDSDDSIETYRGILAGSIEEISEVIDELVSGGLAIDGDTDLLSIIFGSANQDDQTDQEEVADKTNSNQSDEETDLEVQVNSCFESGECDKYGNPITEAGFYNENGKWEDMTNFEPDPDVLDFVETSVQQTAHLAKIGSTPVEAAEESYSEEEAEELSTFDIMDWISRQGQQPIEDDNRAMMIHSLSERYSVPNRVNVDADGFAMIQFSSTLSTLSYDELQERYVWLYTIGSAGSNLRSLSESEMVLNQITEDNSLLRELNERRGLTIEEQEHDDEARGKDIQDDDTIDKSAEIVENELICNLLKMTNSLNAELIPSATDMKMKEFNWTVSFIDNTELVFNFTFENPLFISMGENSDTMKLTFLNTPLYLIPADSRLEAIPDGWQKMIALPPQNERFTFVITPEDGGNGIMALIATNSWLSFAVGCSMQPLFDMINSLQITALLPLTNVKLPSNAMSLFEVIMSIAAFDFFPMYDPGFTETEPYNEKLAWLGVDTINYIQGLGTFLSCLIILLIIQTLIAGGIYFGMTSQLEPYLKHQTLTSRISTTLKQSSWIRNNLFLVAVKQSWIRFILEAYVEILLECFISFRMFDIYKYWNNWDKLAVAVHFIGIAVAIWFFLFVTWFVFIKVLPLNLLKQMEMKQLLNKKIEATRNEMFATQKYSLKQKKNRKLFVSEIQKNEEEVAMIRQDVNEDDYEMYEPLLAGLKLHDRKANMFYLLFLSRRVMLVFTIFLLEAPILLFAQMQVFMLGSLGMLIYDFAASPFASRRENAMEVVNELSVLFVSYYALQLLYSSHDAMMMYQVGNLMILVILGGVVINVVVILIHLLKELKKKFLHWKQQRVVKSRNANLGKAMKKLQHQKGFSNAARKKRASFRKLYSEQVVMQSLGDHGVQQIMIKNDLFVDESKLIAERDQMLSDSNEFQSNDDRLIPMPIPLREKGDQMQFESNEDRLIPMPLREKVDILTPYQRSKQEHVNMIGHSNRKNVILNALNDKKVPMRQKKAEHVPIDNMLMICPPDSEKFDLRQFNYSNLIGNNDTEQITHLPRKDCQREDDDMSGIAAHIVASRNLIEAKDGEAEDDENRNTCKLSKLDISDMY